MTKSLMLHVPTHCRMAGREMPHTITLTEAGGYVSSRCSHCRDKHESPARVDECSATTVRKLCERCNRETEHMRYTSAARSGEVHWFCCSCGRDQRGGD